MQFIASRIHAVRAVVLFGALQLTFATATNAMSNDLITIKEYMERESPLSKFTITGAVVPGSVSFGFGPGKKFKLTDNQYLINCVFGTSLPASFKMNEILVVEAMCPDLNKREDLIVTKVVTKHSMDLGQWRDQRGIQQKNYGLTSAYA